MVKNSEQSYGESGQEMGDCEISPFFTMTSSPYFHFQYDPAAGSLS